jgi:hypothetical protein
MPRKNGSGNPKPNETLGGARDLAKTWANKYNAVFCIVRVGKRRWRVAKYDGVRNGTKMYPNWIEIFYPGEK